MDFGETFPIKNSSFKEFTLFYVRHKPKAWTKWKIRDHLPPPVQIKLIP